MNFLNAFLSIMTFGKTLYPDLLPPRRPVRDEISEEYPVPHWHHHCVYWGHSWHIDIRLFIQGPRDRDKATISQIRWFKDKQGLEHEFLIFTFNGEEPKYEAHIFIERYITKKVLQDVAKAGIPLLVDEDRLASMSDDYKKRMTNSLRDKLIEEWDRMKVRVKYTSRGVWNPENIFDRISFYLGRYPTESPMGASCFGTFTFSDKKFYLRDLGLMVREIHKFHPEFVLGKYDSYWFCRTLMDVITEMKNPTSTTKRLEKKAGSLSLRHFPTLRLIQSNPAQVTQLVTEIKAEIQKSDQRITDRWMQGEGGRALADARWNKTR